ncbi:MAG: DsrE family protein [Actinomycetota bacterium]
MTITSNPETTTSPEGQFDRKVLIGLTNGPDSPEDVLIAYLMGVEALRAGKEAVLWLTKDAVEIAVDGAAERVEVPGAPAVVELHQEFIERGGRFFACPVCVKLRGLTEAVWAKNVEVVGAPSVYEYTTGGALVFNY